MHVDTSLGIIMFFVDLLTCPPGFSSGMSFNTHLPKQVGHHASSSVLDLSEVYFNDDIKLDFAKDQVVSNTHLFIVCCTLTLSLLVHRKM